MVHIIYGNGHRIYGNVPPHQIGRKIRQPRVIILRPAKFDRHVATLAGFVQTFVKPRHQICASFGPAQIENPDHWHTRLLRTCRERPRGGSAAERG